MADGSITIEVKALTDKFDKQIQKLDEKIQKKEKEKIKLEADIKNIKESEAGYDELIKKSDKYGDKLIQAKQKVEELTNARKGLFVNGKIKASEIPQYENYGTQIEEAEAKVKELNIEIANTNKEISKWDNKLINNANKIEAIKAKQAEVTEEVKKYKNQIESVKLQKQQAQVDQIKDGFNKMNTSVSNSIKHIGRLALGIFSVASAYRLMSAASSTLGQYDEQYATNLEYIRYLIAQAIAPALKYVVNLASTLLSYLNYILNAWFGITLFSKNSAKNFMKAKSSTGGISKNTGKIKKDLQTTPFDEMNVLSDTSDSGTGGGAGGGAPSIDPSLLQGEVPDWLKWIADNKDLIIKALIGIALAVGLIKLRDLIGGLEILGPLLKIIKTFLKTHGTTLAGILAIISGIAIIIDGIIKYLKDPSWENFIEIMTGITFVVGGVMLLFGGIPALITAIILILGALGLAIYKHWDEIKETLGKVGDWINEHVIQPVAEFFKGLWDNITNGVKNAVQGIKDIFATVVNFFKGLVSQIVNAFGSLGTKAGEAISGAFKAVVNAVLRTIESVLNAPIRAINRLIGVINNVPGINLGTLSTFNLPRLAKGTILNAPGRGVPVAGGTALAGEAGREAYLPLSDTQLLEELGSTIGKYITINANIPVSMNGRVISRQLQQIRNDKEFAYNG